VSSLIPDGSRYQPPVVAPLVGDGREVPDVARVGSGHDRGVPGLGGRRRALGTGDVPTSPRAGRTRLGLVDTDVDALQLYCIPPDRQDRRVRE
jgi:hypothetical protein